MRGNEASKANTAGTMDTVGNEGSNLWDFDPCHGITSFSRDRQFNLGLFLNHAHEETTVVTI